MKTIAIIAVLFAALTATENSKMPDNSSIHAFNVQTIDGVEKALSDYKGKVVLIVNTASKCGFTPQYEGLQKLYEKYHDDGLEILAFPANNFLWQEPGTNAEIKQFCATNYSISFDLLAKISVKGKNIHPLYQFLTTETDFKGKITWNFNKFLCDQSGKVVARYGSRVKPLDEKITQKIEYLLKK